MGASTIVTQGVTDPVTLEVVAHREAPTLAADLHEPHRHVAFDYLGVCDINNSNKCIYSSVLNETDVRILEFMCINFL